MIRKVLAHEALLAGEQHVAFHEFGIKVAVHAGCDGLYPFEIRRCLKKPSRSRTENDLSVPGLLHRLIQIADHHMRTLAGSFPDPAHVLFVHLRQGEPRYDKNLHAARPSQGAALSQKILRRLASGIG